MPGHQHGGGPQMTQNQGNMLGDRPCVRQSRLYREHVGGNAMKGVMGQDNLSWDTQQTQGAYAGGAAYDPLTDKPSNVVHGQRSNLGDNQSTQECQRGSGRGASNKSSANYNILSFQDDAPVQQQRALRRPQPHEQQQQQAQQQQQQQQQAAPSMARGRGNATKSSASYNILSYE